MKNKIIALAVIILVGVGAYFIINKSSNKAPMPADQGKTETPKPADDKPTAPAPSVNKEQTIIGTSVEGREILAYHYGAGDKEVLFVGGAHGGYEWNTVLLSYQLMDYLKTHPSGIPENVKVTVIPVLNPDGLNKVVGTDGRFAAEDVNKSQAVQTSGRFNANNVDLNRNFDCKWKADAKWQSKPVSGGTAVFSEPESQALKNYVEAQTPDSVVAFFSAAGGVYPSNCTNGISANTRLLMNTYAKASGYAANENFNFYEVTGDMVNWLATKNIPAISVLLTNHTDTEWTKNWAGIEAVLKQSAE